MAHDRSLHYDLQKFAESVKNRTTVYHGLAAVMIDRTPFDQFQPTVLGSFWDASFAEYASLLQIIMYFLKPRSHFHGAVYGELRSITERRTVTLRRYPSTSAKSSGFFRRYPWRAVKLRRRQIYRDKKLSVRNFFWRSVHG